MARNCVSDCACSDNSSLVVESAAVLYETRRSGFLGLYRHGLLDVSSSSFPTSQASRRIKTSLAAHRNGAPLRLLNPNMLCGRARNGYRKVSNPHQREVAHSPKC